MLTFTLRLPDVVAPSELAVYEKDRAVHRLPWASHPLPVTVVV